MVELKEDDKTIDKIPDQIGKYKIMEQLGKGTFAKVYKCIDSETG